jgi:HTH-type transcriptional regulator / antitoxin HigA
LNDVIPRVFPASKYIKDRLSERGWTQADLALVLGRSVTEVNYQMTAKKVMSPEFAQELSVVLGDTPEFWLGLDSAYRLSQTEYVSEDVVRRSALFGFPIKEMQKRRWIRDTKDANEIEEELKRFFGESDIYRDQNAEAELPFTNASFRRSAKEQDLNKAERAWIARARQLAAVVPVTAFNEGKIVNLEKDLRRFASKSQAVHRVPELLAKYGIRFVIVEPLPKVRIDGAAFWLDDKSPVIAMSIRFDNIGSFWFTLLHEVIHIKHKDAFSFDDLSFDDLAVLPEDYVEVRANSEASNILVPTEYLDKFIRTHHGRYTAASINNFATQMQIHPGIIVGQLQYRKEIKYATHRALLAKVRELATTIAVTDGWGHAVPLPAPN